MTRLGEVGEPKVYKEPPTPQAYTAPLTQKIAEAALATAALKNEAVATKMGLPYLVGKAFFLGVAVGVALSVGTYLLLTFFL